MEWNIVNEEVIWLQIASAIFFQIKNGCEPRDENAHWVFSYGKETVGLYR